MDTALDLQFVAIVKFGACLYLLSNLTDTIESSNDEKAACTNCSHMVNEITCLLVVMAFLAELLGC